MNLASVLRQILPRRHANSQRRTRRSPLSLEPLETRCLLTAAVPLVLDFGEGVTVRGVNRLPDGTGLLVGDYVDPQTRNRDGRLYTIAPDGSSFNYTTLGSLGGSTAAFDISPNGQYIAGVSFSPTSDPRGEGEATIWRLQAPEIAIGIGYVLDPLAPLNYSTAVSVSNNGVAVGHSNGGGFPFRWEETVGMQALPGGGPQQASGVSADGSLIVGSTSNPPPQGGLVPSFWSGGALSALATQGMDGIARDISPNGLYVGGSTNILDMNTFHTINQATLWVDDDLAIAADQTASDYRMVLLTDELGNPFDGEVYAISDNGYAVGRANAYNPDAGQKGFIWHESFAGARLFDEWLLAEYGIQLPTPSVAINDVFFDGVNLSFAILGSAYFVTVPPKDPTCQPPGPSFDVNRDGFVTALDVLLVINDVNSKGVRSLSPCYFNQFPNGPFVDVNADGFVSPADVLDTINFINSQIAFGAGEREAAAATLIQAALVDGLFSSSAARFAFSPEWNMLPVSTETASQLDADPPWSALRDASRDGSAFSTPQSATDSPSRDLLEESLLDLLFALVSPPVLDAIGG